MHTNSKFVKRAAGTLVLTVSIVSAVFGLTACGTHGGGGFGGGGGRGGYHGGGGNEKSYSAPFDVVRTIK